MNSATFSSLQVCSIKQLPPIDTGNSWLNNSAVLPDTVLLTFHYNEEKQTHQVIGRLMRKTLKKKQNVMDFHAF